MKKILMIILVVFSNLALAENFQISGDMYSFSDEKGFFHYG